MARVLNRLFLNNRIYVFLCTLAGISPLVGVQGYAWDYVILMFYYFAEAVILMLLGFWKILACELKATPDGSVQVMRGGTAKITLGRFQETVTPMTKSSAMVLFFLFSSFGIGISFIFMCIAFREQGGPGEPFHVIRAQWPLFATAMAGLCFQHGYRFVSDFWLGPQRNYPPGHFAGRSFFRVYLVFFLVFAVQGIAHYSGSHFATVMEILIITRIVVQTAFAAISSRYGKPDAMPPHQPTKIQNRWELEAFLLDSTKDKPLAHFLAEVIEHVGREGYIAVERGGSGTPYSAEYPEHQPDNRKFSEVQSECQRLRQALILAHSPSERDRIEQQLAEYAGGFCTIRINTLSSDEFNRQKALIIDAWSKLKDITDKAK